MKRTVFYGTLLTPSYSFDLTPLSLPLLPPFLTIFHLLFLFFRPRRAGTIQIATRVCFSLCTEPFLDRSQRDTYGPVCHLLARFSMVVLEVAGLTLVS